MTAAGGGARPAMSGKQLSRTAYGAARDVRYAVERRHPPQLVTR